MTHEAPAKGGWSSLTEEQKAARVAKMQAGRKKNKLSVTAEDLDTETDQITVMKLELEKLRELLSTKPTPEPTRAVDPVILNDRECYYAFTRVAKEPPEKIHTPDDPRWDELAKMKRNVFGNFIVNKLTRAKSGEVLSREEETCLNRGPQPAREMMVRFFETGEHVQRLELNKVEVR